jgi:hypothetical protein
LVRYKKFGKTLKIISLFLLLILFVIRLGNNNNSYSLSNEQKFWKKYNLPQIDSTMRLESKIESFETYISWSNDSISHYFKSIEYDFFGVLSVTDGFINKRDSLILISKFISHNILRDSTRSYTLGKWKKKNKKQDYLTKEEFDKLIKDWGLFENLY